MANQASRLPPLGSVWDKQASLWRSRWVKMQVRDKVRVVVCDIDLGPQGVISGAVATSSGAVRCDYFTFSCLILCVLSLIIYKFVVESVSFSHFVQANSLSWPSERVQQPKSHLIFRL